MFHPKITLSFSVLIILFTQISSLNAMNEKQKQAIEEALYLGDLNAFKSLVPDTATANFLTHDKTPEKTYQGYLHVLCRQIADSSFYEDSGHCNPAFIIAACTHLLQLGCDPNVQNQDQQTPLHLLFQGYYAPRDDFNIDNSAGVNLTDAGSSLGNFLDTFFKHGARFDAQDKDEITVIEQFAQTVEDTEDFTLTRSFVPLYCFMLSTINPEALTPKKRVELLLPYLKSSQRSVAGFEKLFRSFPVKENSLQKLINNIQQLQSEQKSYVFGDPVYSRVLNNLKALQPQQLGSKSSCIIL